MEKGKSEVRENSAKLREAEVKTAVDFLLHPKVHGSGEESKRSFLIQKGLTEDEIAEAFARVNGQQQERSGGGEQAVVEQRDVKVKQISWGKGIAALAVVAAGAYAAQKYAGQRLRKWARLTFYSGRPEEIEEAKGSSGSASQQQLSNHYQSVERLLGDLTCEIRNLSTKIDKVLLESLLDSQHRDAEESTHLLPGMSQPSGPPKIDEKHQPMNWMSAGDRKNASQSADIASIPPEKWPSSIIAAGNVDNKQEYMRALGLTTDGGTKDEPQVSGTIQETVEHSTSANQTVISEIVPDTTGQGEGAASLMETRLLRGSWTSQSPEKAWQPPPLPEPVVSLVSEDADKH